MRRAQAGTSGRFPVTSGPDDGGCRAAWGAQVQGVRVRRERRLWEARESPGLLHSLCTWHNLEALILGAHLKGWDFLHSSP